MPTGLELAADRRRLAELRDLKVSRCKILKKQQLEARKLVKILGSVECEDSELFELDHVQPTASNVKRMEAMVLKLAAIHTQREENIKEMLSRLQSTWQELNIPKAHSELITKDIKCDSKTDAKLRAEIERCETIRLGKIPSLIEKLRSEIIDYNKKCMKSQEYRSQSAAFDAPVYDDTSLRRHKLELHHLKNFFEQNETTFKLLAEREGVKSELGLLASMHDSKNRFKNRGGQLLKEEQEKKLLGRKLLKIEVELCKSVDDYEAKTNSRFLVFDKPIVLDRDAKNRLMLKKQPSLTDLRLKKQPFSDRTNKQL